MRQSAAPCTEASVPGLPQLLPCFSKSLKSFFMNLEMFAWLIFWYAAASAHGGLARSACVYTHRRHRLSKGKSWSGFDVPMGLGLQLGIAIDLVPF